MIEKIRGFAEKYDMISSGDTIVCGLSGGADSVCLLLALRRLSEDMGFSVEAAHVNHCLRGDESNRDEDFCRKLCLRLNIPFTAAVCDVRSYAESESVSLEQAARDMRYQALCRIADGKKIATAHNADDNLETILLNLVRGSGIKGLSGIPPVRGNIIRPLLTVSRKEIENYLDSAGQNYVTDSTNLTDDYTRNKIRHNVIPVLKTINSSLADTTVRTADVLRSENDFIESEANAAYEKCCRGRSLYGISEFPEVIRRRCIARLLGTNISHKRLAECDNIAVNGGKLNISGDLYFISDGVSAELRYIGRPDSSGVIEKPLEMGINSIFSGINLVCTVMFCDNSMKLDSVNKKLTNFLIDYDRIIGKAVVRSRKYGDRIQLRGRNFTSSVKKLINETVPVSLRSTLHFIEDEKGTVFAENIGIAQRVAPDENTVRLLKITVERER